MEQTDGELVSRSKDGDKEAFQMLVKRYQRRAYGIALGVLKNSDDAMDAAQEAFIKVFRSIKGFKGDSSFYTWLYRIVVNVCIDQIRKKKRARSVEYDETWHRKDEIQTLPITSNTRRMLPNYPMERRELNEALQNAMAGLSENHRSIILLREVEGLSYEEIAEVMSCHLGTVMSRLHHARKKLQKALKPYLEASGNRNFAQRAGAGVRKQA